MKMMRRVFTIQITKNVEYIFQSTDEITLSIFNKPRFKSTIPRTNRDSLIHKLCNINSSYKVKYRYSCPNE